MLNEIITPRNMIFLHVTLNIEYCGLVVALYKTEVTSKLITSFIILTGMIC